MICPEMLAMVGFWVDGALVVVTWIVCLFPCLSVCVSVCLFYSVAVHVPACVSAFLPALGLLVCLCDV